MKRCKERGGEKIHEKKTKCKGEKEKRRERDEDVRTDRNIKGGKERQE